MKATEKLNEHLVDESTDDGFDLINNIAEVNSQSAERADEGGELTDRLLDKLEDLLLKLSQDGLSNDLSLFGDFLHKLRASIGGHGTSNAGEKDQSKTDCHGLVLVANRRSKDE